VNDDCLKLTTYFGERDRTEGGLLADALLDLYGKAGVRASVLLRGVEGFGLRHHLRTDRLLSLSEDLPMVSVAVDERTRIEALLEEVMKIERRGLVTLERARLLTGAVDRLELPEELNEATKLTVYVGRRERIGGSPAFAAVCDLLHAEGVDGATALLGVDGTRNGSRQRARFFSRNRDVPMMIVAVGAGGRIAGVLPKLSRLLPGPLMTIERVRVCRRDGRLLERPHALPVTDRHGLGLWQKLMVYTAESATHERRPIHTELVRRLRRSGGSGATCLRGLWGFHGDHPPHGDRLFQLRRNVPIVTVIVDSPERVASSFEIVDELTSERGLVTSEMVPAMTAMSREHRRGGLRLARHRF
jgi:PII-like signaling protein